MLDTCSVPSLWYRRGPDGMSARVVALRVWRPCNAAGHLSIDKYYLDSRLYMWYNVRVGYRIERERNLQ